MQVDEECSGLRRTGERERGERAHATAERVDAAEPLGRIEDGARMRQGRLSAAHQCFVPEQRTLARDHGLECHPQRLHRRAEGDFEPSSVGRYRIIRACNPTFAFDAVTREPRVGVLLPCNVVLYEPKDGTAVLGAIDPMEAVGSEPALKDLATEVSARIERFLASVQ